MPKLYSDVELAQRLNIRKAFHDLDGDALVKLSTVKVPFSDNGKPRSSSIYSLPLRPSSTEFGSIMEFGPAHDPELMGGGLGNQPGMLLWCSLPNGQPFVDLAKQCGYQGAHCRGADLGSLIDLGCTADNSDVIQLALEMVKTLISAFEFTAQDTAFVEHGSMRTDSEILLGKPASKSTTL